MSKQPPNILALVAEDDPDMRALVAEHLRLFEGCAIDVIEAEDGQEAFRLVEERMPDLVVLDVMMPEMSGWEVCRKIREHAVLGHTGVLMLTGIGQTLNELTSPLYGADAYLDKPFEADAFFDKIRQILARPQTVRSDVEQMLGETARGNRSLVPLVLVAEDDMDMREMIASHLRLMTDPELDVAEAEDGEEALRMTKQLRPAVVILDVMMPNMSGWEVCKKIRSDRELDATGVVILTGMGHELNELTSPLYGADHHLDKPFDAETLFDIIRKVLAARYFPAVEKDRSARNGTAGPARPRVAGDRPTGVRKANRQPPKKATTKKPLAKKAATKKPLAKKAATKKPAAKKATTKKPLAKKAATKKPLAKKAATKKPLAKKAATKKPSSRR